MIATRTAKLRRSNGQMSPFGSIYYNPQTHFNRGTIAQTGLIPEGTQLLQDTFPLKVLDTKSTISEAFGESMPVTRVTGLFQIADDTNANGRVYASQILREAVDAIQEDIAARAVWGEFDHPCGWVPSTSGKGGIRVLTTNGWKDFEDIKIGDYIWSRKAGQLTKSRVNQIVNEPFDGDLYHFKGRNIDSAFTPGHRFLLLRRPERQQFDETYRVAEDLYTAKRVHSAIPRVAVWEGAKPLFVTIPGVPESELPAGSEARYKHNVTEDLHIETGVFCGFLGLYLAEGGCNPKEWRIDISQKTKHGRDAVRLCLDRIHHDLEWNEDKHGFNLYDIRLHKWLQQCGGLYNKRIPHEIKALDAEYLEELVYWFAVGDGRLLHAGDRDSSYTSTKTDIALVERHKLDLGMYSRVSMFTVSKQLIDDLHECIVKTGHCAKLSEVIADEDYEFADHIIEAKNKKPLYQLHLSRTENIYVDKRFMKIDRVHRSGGRIQCLSVDHGNFYMEQNGHSFWTGNSDAKIHLERISHLITRIWMEGKQVFGEAEIITELPHGSQLKTLLKHGTIGISSRGIGDMEVRDSGGQELYYVTEGYRFVTWDAVAEPSVSGAILHIAEGKLRPLTSATVNKLKPKFGSKKLYESMLVKELAKLLNS